MCTSGDGNSCGSDNDGCDSDCGGCDSDTGGCDSDCGGCDSDTGGCDSDCGGCDSDTGGCDSDCGGCDSDTGGCDSDTGECGTGECGSGDTACGSCDSCDTTDSCTTCDTCDNGESGDNPDVSPTSPCAGQCCVASAGGTSDVTDCPIRWFNGDIAMVVENVATSGFGMPWGHRRAYSNQLPQNHDFGNGYNWMIESWPYMVKSGSDQVAVIFTNRKAFWFTESGGTCTATIRHRADAPS